MNKVFAVLIVAIAGLATVTTADAAAGCGKGWHPNAYGHCVLNKAERVCPAHYHLNSWGNCSHN